MIDIFGAIRGAGAALLLAAAAAPAQANGPEPRACDFSVQARCASGSAQVTLVDGVLQKIAIGVDFCAAKGGLNYGCTLDSSRGDGESLWSDAAGATVIANAHPFNSAQLDRIKVTIGRHVSIDLSEAQSLGRCGAGAELPRAIVIPAKKGRCRIWFEKE
jgi:hypothetical protein